MNGGRRIEFESGSNISGLYDRRVFSGFSYMPLRVHELMPGSIIAQFEKDLSHIHGNQIWYGNHGPTLGGLACAFEDQEYSTSEEDDYISEEEYYDEEDEFEYSYYHEEGEEYGEEL